MDSGVILFLFFIAFICLFLVLFYFLVFRKKQPGESLENIIDKEKIDEIEKERLRQENEKILQENSVKHQKDQIDKFVEEISFLNGDNNITSNITSNITLNNSPSLDKISKSKEKIKNEIRLYELTHNGIQSTYDTQGNYLSGIKSNPKKALEHLHNVLSEYNFLIKNDDPENQELNKTEYFYYKMKMARIMLEEDDPTTENVYYNLLNEIINNELHKDMDNTYNNSYNELFINNNNLTMSVLFKIKNKSLKDFYTECLDVLRRLYLNRTSKQNEWALNDRNKRNTKNTIDASNMLPSNYNQIHINEENINEEDIALVLENIRLNQIIEQNAVIENNMILNNNIPANTIKQKEEKTHNDTQNTHNTGVVGTVRSSINNLLAENRINFDRMFDKSIDKNVEKNYFSEITDKIRSLGHSNKISDALKSLNHIKNQDSIIHAYGISEKQALVLFYERLKQLSSNNSINKTLLENLANELAEMQEHGKTVCTMGRINRIISTLDGIDDKVKIMPSYALKEEMLNKSAKIAIDFRKKPGNESDEADVILKNMIRETLYNDYVNSGIMSNEKFAIETDWIEFI